MFTMGYVTVGSSIVDMMMSWQKYTLDTNTNYRVHIVYLRLVLFGYSFSL